ncbi:TPM domain-containing protein [Tepidimicrobium xylanilyticum]|uniref:TPM domain-containing protein n=1 Tax=Tepidimicrobium xylanilyticum TaxID=1123352 RepID=A0A1H2TXL1_9FIRM|nr:TPM domain-containing protein [Tepidimicrobium xylanilyticum]GMG98051.1 methanol dehydrogenase [Tepidimicrobium xylanilyticum]SDW48726.1 uncharacterized protein SAMN05660923_00839 [Tepidimicrobium xylanilyticum]
MKNKKILILFLSILLIFIGSCTFEVNIQLPEPSYSFYVYDEANIIDGQVEQYIIDTNKDLYKKTGAQIVVATVLDLRGMDINRFASELFEKWGIGSREYDNGLLILVVPEDREIWIEVGYGLEGALPDSKIGNIINGYIIPYFKESDYSTGILSGFNEIINEVEEEYNIQLARGDINWDIYYIPEDYIEENPFNGLKTIVLLVGIILFLFVDFKFFNGFLTYSLFRGSRFGGSSSTSRGRRSSGGGGRSGGGGARGRW